MAMARDPKFLMIDLFCGAGGTTHGAKRSGKCLVIAAVNHDPLAIKSHAKNNSEVFHITEDILTLDLTPLKKLVEHYRALYPKAKLILWASLECTNFSNAKGGLPRDADSRALATGLFRYIEALDPDLIQIENVKEFMSWGELDENGKPKSKTKGRDYIRWVKEVQKYGYNFDYRFLCAADFGGVTIRERYFAGFWKKGVPFAWPQPTHAKRPQSGTMFSDDRKRWRPVSEILDFNDLGRSIFDRKKPLVDKSLRRILAGLRKFHHESQIVVYNSPGYCSPISEPIGSITTVPSKAFMTPILAGYYSGERNTYSIKRPAPTVSTKDRFMLVTPWIDRNFRSGRYQSVKDPAGAVLTIPKINLCSAFLVNHQYRSAGSSINNPAPTVIARQKSYPLSLATVECEGNPKWDIEESDTAIMRELKNYMREHGITDIWMRMLKISELKKIQGFPEDYYLAGKIEDQKKFIGNSVETTVVCAWLTALSNAA